MSMIHVGINGYGTIGKRVAAAVDVQPDMTVVGVSKRSLDHEAAAAVDRGFDLYVLTPRPTTQAVAVISRLRAAQRR